MSRICLLALVSLALSGSLASAQGTGAPGQPAPAGLTTNPFPQPIAASEGVIAVTLREFASLPDIDGIAARMMTLVEEPATRRLFVSEMRGVLYVISPGWTDRDAVPQSPRREVVGPGAITRPRARAAEFRPSPAVCAGGRARIRQVLHLRGYVEPGAARRLHDAKHRHHARPRAA